MGSIWAAQPQTSHLQDPLEMRKLHLNSLATLPRLLEGWRAGQRSGDFSCVLVDAARDLAGRRVGTALLLEVTGTAIERAAPVDARGALVHNRATGRQDLALT